MTTLPALSALLLCLLLFTACGGGGAERGNDLLESQPTALPSEPSPEVGSDGGAGAAEVCATAAKPIVSALAIYGSSLLGSILDAHFTLLDDGPYRYQWLRDGVPIVGADSVQYLSTNDDLNHFLQFEVIGESGMRARSDIIGPIRAVPLDASAETVSAAVEYQFQTTSDFYPENTYQHIFTWRGNTYFVWVDTESRPMIGKLNAAGEVSTAFLEDEDYRIRADGHHKFTIAVDTAGYIHVLGDMHNMQPAQADADYLSRFSGAQNMYWVSDAPESISGFSFVGNTERAIPGWGLSYVSLRADQDGVLYAKARVQVHQAGHYSGQMGFGLYRYDISSQRWEALGGLPPDHTEPAYGYLMESEYPVLFWEDNGMFDGDQGLRSWYQGFITGFAFDFNNHLHAAVTINNDNLHPASTHVLYARSNDGGEHFTRADNSAIEALPIRAEAGPSQGDVVASYAEAAFDDFGSFADPMFDRDGTPLVHWLDRYRYWDRQQQSWSDDQSPPTSGVSKVAHQLDINGVITFVGLDMVELARTYELDEPAYRTWFLSGKQASIDQGALREQGVLRILRAERVDDVLDLSLVRFDIEPELSPLPEAWQTQTLNSAAGEAGVFNNAFHLLAEGAGGFSPQGDRSLMFVEQSAGQNLSLSARLVNVNYSSERAVAGLMLSSGDASDASYYALTLSNHQGLQIHVRDNAGYRRLVLTGVTPSEWLKVERNNDEVRAYRSPDGQQWQLVDSQRVVLNHSVAAGLVAAGGAGEGRARIDKVQLNALRREQVCE